MENEPTESGLMYFLFGEDHENEFEGANAETNHTQRENVETNHTQGGTTVNEFDLSTQPDDCANEETLNEDFNTRLDDTNDGSNNVEMGPRTGMQHATLDSLFDAYQEHARLAGFSAVKRTSRKLDEDEYKYALFVCCKSGKPTSHTASKRE
ncbi:hypothetical protein C2S52_019470 [Perilla frutescens var. hirtella]|nr:hypothetical protein C2S52_019470 [Perilla frutescens var. hirtella]